MSTPHTCPKCGAQLPADAPEGLCPACLMIGGLPSDAATLKMTPSQKPGGAQPPPTPSPEELAPYFPQLEIMELLGRGGMGMVYKARQKNLNRLVALKILPVEPDADEHFAERFQREAQALARLNHPNIVSVFDFGEAKKGDDPGLFYFLMEFVDGANLRTLIRSGEMKPEAALALIPAFCDALQYAHDEGVVHRDIKPENVLVDKKGRVKIADFGLAKLLGHDSTDHTLTRTGMSLGTPRYMAPEQMDKPETVDHRADIYSLGVVFYEMLTGELPMGRFPLPSQKVQVDVRFDEIVLHALEKEPSLRYQQASQIKTDVQSVTNTPLVKPPAIVNTMESSPVLLLDETDRTGRRHQHIAMISGMILIVLGIVWWGLDHTISPLSVVPWIAGVFLFIVAGRIRQQWEVDYLGHVIRFENSVWMSGRLMIDGNIVASGGIGPRTELSGRIPRGSGAGERIVARNHAGFLSYHCQIFAEPRTPTPANEAGGGVANVTNVQRPSPTADSIPVDGAAPDAVAPLPRYFWWRAFGLLMLGWLVVGALWNLRMPGCVLGALVLSGITIEIAIRHVSRKARWAREWREAPALNRVFITSGYVAFGVIPFMMLLGAMEVTWEISSMRWNWSAKSGEQYVAEQKGKEYQLIRNLSAFKDNLPTTELSITDFSWGSGLNVLNESGPFSRTFSAFPIMLGAVGALVMLLLFFQQIAGAERVSVWRLVLGGWRPAFEFMMITLCSAVVAYGILATTFIFARTASWNNDTNMHPKIVNASAQQVQMALQKWAVENNFWRGDDYRWNLMTVPRGQTVAQTAIFSAWKPSPFDRWHMTWTGMRKMHPHVAAQITGTEKPAQSIITISARMNMLDKADEEQMKRVMKDMEDAVEQAAKMDVKKPLGEQITTRDDDSAASTGITGWWLIGGVVGLSIAWTFVRYGRGKSEANQASAPAAQPATKNPMRWESWWLSRPTRAQKLMAIVLGVVFVASLICFFSFRMQATTTADHSGVVRHLYDFTVGLGDPWLYLFHHKTGTRTGMESGMNWLAGSALFGFAAACAGAALTRLTREQKRRSKLADVSTDAPQQRFFWNTVAGAVLFIAGVAGVIVHEVRNDSNGGLLADAVHEVHPDFTRPGITSLALKKAIADELKLTPEQLEKINAALNRAYFDFLKLENEHSEYRSENRHLVKLIKPFPDRSFALAQELAAELRGIAGKSIIDDPERNAVWKLRLFRHAGEFDVRAELWEKDGKFHREESWMRDGKKIMGGKSGDTLDDMKLAFGHYVVDWEIEKDDVHEPRPEDAHARHTLGPDVLPFMIERIRNGELARLLAVKEPDTVVKSGNPHAALVAQAGTSLGRACAETELKRHGIPFAKDAKPEELVKKLEELLGATPKP